MPLPDPNNLIEQDVSNLRKPQVQPGFNVPEDALLEADVSSLRVRPEDQPPYRMPKEVYAAKLGDLNRQIFDLKSRFLGRTLDEEKQLSELEKERLKYYAYPGDTQEDIRKRWWDAQGVQPSNIVPWEWVGGFGTAKLLANLGRTTFKGALTRSAMTAVPMAATETGAEIAAEAFAPENPWINLGISLGLGLTAGNFMEAVIDRKALQLINSKAPNFFSQNLEQLIPANTKNVSELVKARLKVLAGRMDEGDMVALREARDLVKKSYYTDRDSKMVLTRYGDAKEKELTRRQLNRQVLKKSFGDITENDLDEIQKISEIRSYKGFDQEFNNIKNKVNNKLAIEAYRDHPVVNLVTEIKSGGGFNENRLVRMIGQQAVDDLKSKYKNLIEPDGGVDPIKKAVANDYASVEEMIYDMAQTPSLKQVRNSINRQMEYDWNVLYYDEFARRMGGTELKMWEKIGGKKMVQRIRSAAKREQQLAGGEPRTLRDITNETNFIRRVARRGANAAMQITKADERLTALAKAAALKESTRDKSQIVRAEGRMKNALRDTGLPEDYQDQVHRYLQPYFPKEALADIEGPGLRNFLDAKVEEGVPLSKLMRDEYDDILELPQTVPDKLNLNTQQFEKLGALVQDLRRMGKSQRRIENIAKGQVINDYVQSISDTADNTFKKMYAKPTQRAFVSGKAQNVRSAKTDRMSRWLSDLKRPEFILRELDNWQDFGNAQKMFRAAKKAEDMNFQISKVLTDRWKDILQEYADATGKRLSRRFWKKRFEDSVTDFSADRETMLTMAAMTGNQHNKAALLNSLGDETGPMSDIVINRFLRENMTEADWGLVRNIWKMTDEMYDYLADVYKTMTGKTLPKVKNYFPIIPDYKFSNKVIKENMEDVFTQLPDRSQIPRNVEKRFFRTRVGGSDAIRLDFDALAKHLRDVSHTSSHWEITDDLYKVVHDNKFRKSVTENLGPDKYNVLKEWVDDLINPAQTNAPTLRRLRANVTIAMLGWKLTTALVQPLSLVAAAPRVGKGNLAVAASRFMKNPMKTYQAINEVSEQMAMRNQAWQRDIREILDTKTMEKFKKIGTVDRNIFFSLIRAGDVVGAYTTWYAGWLKGMQKFNGDANKAIAYADQSVRLTQPQSSIKDLPKIMRDPNEFKRILTMFYSYYSVLHNQAAELFRRRTFGDASWGEVITALHYMYIFPPIIKSLTQERSATTPEGLIAGVASHVGGGVPLLRDVISSSVMGYDYTLTPAAEPLKATVDLAREVQRAMTDEDYEFDVVPFTDVALTAAALKWGIPSSQIMTMVRGAHAAANDEDVNPIDVILKKRRMEE